RTRSPRRAQSASERASDSRRPKVADVARVIVWVAVALTPIVLVADCVFDATGTASCVLSARALAPLTFVIGEATENIAKHTGAGIGGFLNASSGNAPDALYACVVVAFGIAGDRWRPH